MTLITGDILRLYKSFKGDIDGLTRSGSSSSIPGLTDGWCAIDRAMQDIQMINGRLCSEIYAASVLERLRQTCDMASFDTLTAEIHCYANFQAVAGELTRIAQYITPETDTLWAGFDSAALFMHELREDIKHIRNCHFATLEKIRVEFAATGTYQELAISNGWNDDFIKIAERFDDLYAQLKNKRCTAAIAPVKNIRPWWKFWK